MVKTVRSKLRGWMGGGSQTPVSLPPYSLLFAFLNLFLLLPPSLPTPQLRAPPVHPSIFKVVREVPAEMWIGFKVDTFRELKKIYNTVYDTPTPFWLFPKGFDHLFIWKCPMNLNVLIVYLEMHNYTPKSWWHT